MEALLWIDLETTGLDPHTGQILEIAVVLTDMNLKVLKSEESLINSYDLPVGKIQDDYCDEFIVNMHTQNGLWEDLATAHANYSSGVGKDGLFSSFITNWISGFEITALHPAGSSVHFDIGWLKVHMPSVAELLHYRQLDITSLKLAQQVATGSYDKDGVTAHRAMADALGSLAWFKNYLNPVAVITDVEAEATRLLHQMKVQSE